MSADAGRLFGVRTLVCGAATGVGEAIARTCARHAADVVALDSGDSDVERRFNSVPHITGLARPLSTEQAKDIVADVAKRLDGLDAVIVCTQLQPRQPIADSEECERVVKARLAELRRWFDAALPKLKRSPGGRFIAVGLLRSAFAVDAQPLSDDAEAALAGLVRELAAESGEAGITVNYVQPGAIMTAESRRVFGEHRELRDHCIRHSAARRLGEPLDVAKAALFLASDDATFVSGTGIAVDGGRAG